MRCPMCELFCRDAFGLSAHMSEQHPITSPAPFSTSARAVRQFEPIERHRMRFPVPKPNPEFPGVDIDAIRRNPKYARVG